MGFKNDLQLRQLKYAGKAAYVNDEGMANLYVRVLKTKKKFVYRYKLQGVIKEKTLGEYPQMSLLEARNEAEALNCTDKSQVQQIITLKAVFEQMKDMIDVKRRLSFEKHIINMIGEMEIQEIKRSHIFTCLDKIAQEQKYETCKRTLQILKRIFKYAVNKEYIEYSILSDIDYASMYKTPPVQHMKAIVDKKRFRDLILAIENYKCGFSTKVCLQLSPYVFLRSNNIRNLEWSEIDFENRWIMISASKMKGGEDFIVPLSESMVRILESIKPYTGNDRLVFPSDIAKNKALSENTLNQAIKRMGFGEEMVYHGFRTTFSTLAYENMDAHGFSSEVIELCLDHRERNKIKAAYNRSKMLEQRRELMQWWSDMIDSCKL